MCVESTCRTHLNAPIELDPRSAPAIVLKDTGFQHLAGIGFEGTCANRGMRIRMTEKRERRLGRAMDAMSEKTKAGAIDRALSLSRGLQEQGGDLGRAGDRTCRSPQYAVSAIGT